MENKWVKLAIDDRFPVDGTELRFSQLSNEGELWPVVFEKAFAKMFGSCALMLDPRAGDPA